MIKENSPIWARLIPAWTDAEEFPQAELEPEEEHEEDDAELRKRVDRGGIGDQGNGDVGPDDHAGDQVSEDHRLPKLLEDHRGYTGDAENDRQALEEFGSAMHGVQSSTHKPARFGLAAPREDAPPQGRPKDYARALTACSMRSIPFSMFFMDVA